MIGNYLDDHQKDFDNDDEFVDDLDEFERNQLDKDREYEEAYEAYDDEWDEGLLPINEDEIEWEDEDENE